MCVPEKVYRCVLSAQVDSRAHPVINFSDAEEDKTEKHACGWPLG